MKSFTIGLCLVVMPAFASNASCPQSSLYSSLIGCQTFDSLFTSNSTASLTSSLVADVPLVSPQTTQLLPGMSTVVVPTPQQVSPQINTVLPSSLTEETTLTPPVPTSY